MKDVEFLREWQPSNLENPWTKEIQDLKKKKGGGGVKHNIYKYFH